MVATQAYLKLCFTPRTKPSLILYQSFQIEHALCILTAYSDLMSKCSASEGKDVMQGEPCRASTPPGG